MMKRAMSKICKSKNQHYINKTKEINPQTDIDFLLSFFSVHRCNEHELGETPGNGERQEGPVCCSPWGHKELDTSGRMNNNVHIYGHSHKN